MRNRPEGAGSWHRALFYRERDEFLGSIGSFMRAGLDAGERVLAVVAVPKVAWLRAELGRQADAVDFADAGVFYRPPGHSTRTVLEWLGGRCGRDRPARLVAEQPLTGQPGADAAQLANREAAANLVFAPFAVSILCPYDTGALPGQVLLDAQRTHPELVQRDSVLPSELFAEPREFLRERSVTPQPPPGAACVDVHGPGDLSAARRLLRDQAAAAGLGPARASELVAAAGEVVANALVHGRPPRRVWAYPGRGGLICHVQDGGPGLADPLACYLGPGQGPHAGCGLQVASKLTDWMDVTTTADGTHVRLLAVGPGR